MRIALAVAALGSSFAVCAADPPLEFTLAHAGAEPITFEAPADEPTVIALADLTRGKPRSVRLPDDAALEIRPSSLGPWMSVNLALHRATARAERRIDKPGVAMSMPVADRSSTHRSVELRPGQSAEVPLDGFVLTVTRLGG